MNKVTRTLKLGDLLALAAALGSLDHYTKVIQDQPVRIPYDFTDTTRRIIVKNKRALKPHVEDFQDFKLALIREVSGGKDSIPDSEHEKLGALNARIHVAQKEEETVELFALDEAQLLKGDKNPIPSSVLEALWPITDEAPAAS